MVGTVDGPRMRPSFEVELDVAGETVLATLRARLARRGAPVTGTVMPRRAELRTPDERAHFWSPNLSLEVERDEGGTERLRGRFAPAPSVWMMFMGIYGALGMGGLLALMVGISEMMVGEPPWALAGVPVALLFIGLVFGATFIGQGLGATEMYSLRSFVDDAVDDVRRGTKPG